MSGPDDMQGDMPEMTPDEILALDLALGALPREERRAAQLRLRSDPAFRALVEGFEADLSPLDATTDPVLPPRSVWEGILAETAPQPVRTAAPVSAPKPSLWNSLALWRGLGFAGTAAAAIALVTAAPQRQPLAPAEVATATPEAPPQMLAASLAGADGTPLLSATWDPLRGTVVITPAAKPEAEAAGTTPELWVIEGDKPPRSLGTIDISGPNAHAISSQRIAGLQPGSTLAISIEPMGGSPTGLPTGPVVATGKLSAI